MSSEKTQPPRTPVNGGKSGLAAASAAAGEEAKPAGPKSGPERQVCASSAGVSALTDSTKRFRLCTSQEPASLGGPGMLQHKARRASSPSSTTDEKPKKSVFPLRLTRGKKEKHAPHDKNLSSTGTSRKGKPTSVAKEDGPCPTERPRTEVLPAFRPSRENYSKGDVKPSAVSSPVGSSVDYEEDMYRDAEEIEREKEWLVCGAGTSVSPENKLSVAPEVDIMDYCQKEWRGSTSSAKRMRKGYEAVSQRFVSIRRVRGDNYCAVRATLFQALSQTLRLPDWLRNKDLMLLPEHLMAKYDWIAEWQKLTGKAENWTEEIKGCLLLLKQKWESISAMKTLAERQAACDELFAGEEDEYRLYEAVKFLMLNTAVKLYEDNQKGLEVPEFSWLLFARDTSSDPFQLMKNHLNQLGHTGGLEQVEMFLLAYTLQHSLHVYRLYKYGTDEFLALYPSGPEEGWPVVTLITEDDRHYNVPVRMCEETSL
ncbi:PREDICTED: ubiquitin thioesterase otulin isoform X2 [Gekko japonicus]|uniref:Ubiquitin thioesterase otulin isoform X2 n=1 Tax=Gekko japonicus TaxID=146911 RepID=A0ABM1KD80_GEKJA|nr:PREDICTED: ubiquitin thioesterase otulin isoform X2 [Gekko japonicus]